MRNNHVHDAHDIYQHVYGDMPPRERERNQYAFMFIRGGDDAAMMLRGDNCC